MPKHWHPDEKFLEFMEFIQKKAGVMITVNGKTMIDEIRVGTERGADLYDKLYNDPTLQEAFQDWKDAQKP